MLPLIATVYGFDKGLQTGVFVWDFNFTILAIPLSMGCIYPDLWIWMIGIYDKLY
jgi:hypothetical protein